MAGWREGDGEAFRELFARWSPRLFSFFLAMNRDMGDAQDLVQETWLRVFRARDRFDTDRPFRPWLFRIASRLQSDLIRSWGWKIRRLSVSAPAGAEGPGPAALDGIADAKPGPQESAESGERSRLLRAALARLPGRHRQAVVMHDLEGMTAEEVAEALGCPLSTALSWIQRGRRRLRVLLAGKGEWA